MITITNTIIARICIVPPTALYSSDPQAEKATAKIQYKKQSKYTNNINKVK